MKYELTEKEKMNKEKLADFAKRAEQDSERYHVVCCDNYCSLVFYLIDRVKLGFVDSCRVDIGNNFQWKWKH